MAFAVPPVASQGLEMSVREVRWIYGPETWKSQEPTPTDPAAPYSGWKASLGLRLEVDLELNLPPTPAQKEVVATLTDGLIVVTGVRSGASTFMFDVDGHRALPGLAAASPLAPRPWTLEVTAQESAGPLGGPFPLGSASEVILPMAVELAAVRLGEDLGAGIRLPESDLPRFRDVAAGPDVWLAAHTLRLGDQLQPRVATGVPGAEVTWTAWAARGDPVRLPEENSLPGQPTPVDAVLPDLAGATTSLVSVSLGSTWANGRGFAQSLINVTQLSDALGVAQDLVVVSAQVQDGGSGGATAFVVGFAPDAPDVAGFVAPEPDAFGSLGVGVDVITNGTNAVRGEVMAYSNVEGNGESGRLLVRGPVGIQPDGSGRAYLDTRPLRASGESGYRAVAFFQTLAGDYAGHATALRGLEPVLVVPRLAESHEATVRLDLANKFNDRQPAVREGHSVVAYTRLTVGGEDLGERLATVPEGGTLSTNWLVVPGKSGLTEIVVSVDTGDLLFEHSRWLTVLTEDAYAKQAAPWYDLERYTPGPGPGLVVLLLGLAGWRRGWPPSRNG